MYGHRQFVALIGSAGWLLVVTPQAVFGMLTSAQALVVTLFGGVGTLWGPVIGASILVPLNETLQAKLGNVIPGIQGVVYGFAVILVILLAPEGLFWRVRDRIFARPGLRTQQPMAHRYAGIFQASFQYTFCPSR